MSGKVQNVSAHVPYDGLKESFVAVSLVGFVSLPCRKLFTISIELGDARVGCRLSHCWGNCASRSHV